MLAQPLKSFRFSNNSKVYRASTTRLPYLIASPSDSCFDNESTEMYRILNWHPVEGNFRHQCLRCDRLNPFYDFI